MNLRALFFLCMVLAAVPLQAQVPVEVFGGHQRTTIDIMFFKYVSKKQGINSPFLFFNRNRASVDYRMTGNTHLPQFGFTEAISFNPKKWKGFAPVAVVQVLNRGVLPKAGIQYVVTRKSFTFFTWLVCETLARPDMDYFLLARYTPRISDRLTIYAQAESVNSIPLSSRHTFTFTQRLRLGLSTGRFQFGAATDVSQTGNKTFTRFLNAGAFVRYEFAP